MIQHQHRQLTGFAEACFNQNSRETLFAALDGPTDTTDCEVWGITPQQWREGVQQALAAKNAQFSDDAPWSIAQHFGGVR